MIILTEISERIQGDLFISEGRGVWRYSFGGDETYTDDQGAEFYWSGRRQIIDLRGVRFGTVNYTQVATLALCRTTTASFFWDDAERRLYVHHENNENHFTRISPLFVLSIARAGYATGRLPGQNQYFSELFFDPLIINIGRLTKQVDPLRFGLMTFESSDFTLINSNAQFDSFTVEEALNAQVIFVLMAPGQTDINAGERIFSGFTGGAQHDDDRIAIRLAEARTFYNRNVCPNVFDTTTYPSLDPKFENKRVPVAYGDIRKGICVPIDSDGVETGDAATITFKLADESLHAIRSVTAPYDSNGDSVTLGTINLTQCTVQYSKAAGKEVDLGAFQWEGEGYDLPAGDYNNGLDIMRDVFDVQSDYQYNSSTYDTTAWAAETAANTAPVGISVQSEKGVIEEIVEPITVSLQGVVDVLGDGRFTYRSRDTTAAPARSIEQYQILSGPDFELNVDSVVSTIVVDYAPNFMTPEDRLSYIYDANEDEIIGAFGLKRSRPVSPIKTVLVNASDALAVALEVASTTEQPEQLVTVSIPIDDVETNLLDIVQLNIARPHKAENWKVYEVLGKGVGFSNNQITQQFILRLLPNRVALFVQFITTEDDVDIITELTAEELTTEN